MTGSVPVKISLPTRKYKDIPEKVKDHDMGSSDGALYHGLFLLLHEKHFLLHEKRSFSWRYLNLYNIMAECMK